MKKVLLLIVILLIITWPAGGSTHPKVDADDFIFEPDSLGVAALMTMVSVDEVVKPDEVVVTTCNCKAGKVSYDGGRSLSTCPCGVNGGKCTCKDCPYNTSGDAPKTETIEGALAPVNYEDYYIRKVTAPWCGPCKNWNVNIKPSFDKAGLNVKELDYDSNLAIINDALIDEIPYFIVCTKVDNLYHHMPLDKNGNKCGVYGKNGSDFSVEVAKLLIAELDAKLHPSKIDGIYYTRQQNTQMKLDNTYWATKAQYIKHLRNHANHKNDIVGWPLEALSVYELKAIHDDDHANKLGALHGI